MKLQYPISFALSFLLFSSSAQAGAALDPREIQIKSIDFETGVVELFNFGISAQPLDGFRFCTQDDNETLRYTASTGFNGNTIQAGASFFIHYNNDAPGGALNAINRSTLGGTMALPLDNNAHALSLYFPPVNFGNGNTMADHVQWNINGADNATADERSDEAEAGGVWKDQSQWVSTIPNTRRIVLTDYSGTELHGPRSYTCVSSNVWSWYRFEEPTTMQTEDIADHAVSNATYFVPGDVQNGWVEWLDHPNQTMENRNSHSLFWSKPLPQKSDSPIFTNFTLETIMQFNPGGEFIDFFSWGTGNGFSDTNSLISAGWIDSGAEDITIDLRDKDVGSSTSTQIRFPIDFPADHHWHHIAFVKEATDLHLYIDYSLRATAILSSAADGGYLFDTNALIRLGSAPNNASAANTNNVADEIRLTLAALGPNEFIYPTQPIIQSCRKDPNLVVRVLVKTSTTYQVQGTTSPTGSWSIGGPFTSSTSQLDVNIGAPAGPFFIRIVEP